MNRMNANKPKPFIVASMGTVGDMYPFLSIALALQKRGHPVTFCGPQIHARHVLAAGIPFYGLGTDEEYRAIIDNPDLWHPQKGVGTVLRSIGYGISPFVEFMKTLPAEQSHVVLAHPLVLPAADIVRRLGMDLKIVAGYLAPANMRTVHDPLTIGPLLIPSWLPKAVRRWIWSRIDARLVNPPALPGLNAIRKEYGLTPVSDFISHMHGIADLSLSLFPSWFAKSQSDWPQPMHGGDFQLYDPAPERRLAPELAAFLAGGTAPLVFTPGTGNLHAKAYFECALRACERLGRRAIFLTVFREQVPRDLPDTVLWQEYLPFRTLLPQVAAIVHHGGIGTTAEALCAGIPQLVLPLAHDQFDNGARVQALGVGDMLITSRLRLSPLLRKLGKLLTSAEIERQCRTVAANLAGERDNSALCEVLEAL